MPIHFHAILQKARQRWKSPQDQQICKVLNMHALVLDQVSKLDRPPESQQAAHWHIYVDGSANIKIEEELMPPAWAIVIVKQWVDTNGNVQYWPQHFRSGLVIKKSRT